jgi:pyruvate dehydrogenase E1 component alpha subunit
VEQAARGLIAQVRGGAGPHFLHATTHRWYGHLAHDRQLYRDPADIERVRQDDCIVNAERWLARHEVGADRLAELRLDCRQQIDMALEEAAAAPWPEPASAFTDVQDIGGAG